MTATTAQTDHITRLLTELGYDSIPTADDLTAHGEPGGVRSNSTVTRMARRHGGKQAADLTKPHASEVIDGLKGIQGGRRDRASLPY